MKHYTLTAEQMRQVRMALNLSPRYQFPKTSHGSANFIRESDLLPALATLDAAMKAPEDTAGVDAEREAEKLRSVALRAAEAAFKQAYPPPYNDAWRNKLAASIVDGLKLGEP